MVPGTFVDIFILYLRKQGAKESGKRKAKYHPKWTCIIFKKNNIKVSGQWQVVDDFINAAIIRFICLCTKLLHCI